MCLKWTLCLTSFEECITFSAKRVWFKKEELWSALNCFTPAISIKILNVLFVHIESTNMPAMAPSALMYFQINELSPKTLPIHTTIFAAFSPSTLKFLKTLLWENTTTVICTCAHDVNDLSVFHCPYCYNGAQFSNFFTLESVFKCMHYLMTHQKVCAFKQKCISPDVSNRWYQWNRWVISWLVIIDYCQWSLSNLWIIDRSQNFHGID